MASKISIAIGPATRPWARINEAFMESLYQRLWPVAYFSVAFPQDMLAAW